MTIGTLTLSPEFNGETLTYTTTTTNASNKITAVALDTTAVIKIDIDGVAVDNETSYTWASGDNIVTITVTDANTTNNSETVYVITVRKLSNACLVTSSTVPDNATIGTDTITASVINTVEGIIVNVTTSDFATWKLYSDLACTTEITDKTLALNVGDNLAYIKVVAENAIATKIYTLTVTRAGA